MKTKIVILCFLCFLFIIMLYINRNIFEYFQNYNTTTPLTSHNVDMPINTYYSCKNVCGPNAQCYLTREQCTSDVDCYGCQPIVPPSTPSTTDIVGDNDAGRLIYNQNPRYSVLTTDIGTKAALYTKQNAPVPKPYLGVDNWVASANYGLEQQRNDYSYQYSKNPEEYKFIPHYSRIESATGLFMDTGPLPSNAYINET